MLLGALDPDTWGTAAEWFAAAASAAALIIALVIFKREGSQLRAEAQALRDEREDSIWRQARQTEVDLGVLAGSDGRAEPTFDVRVTLTVFNNSDGPIRLWHMRVQAGEAVISNRPISIVVPAGGQRDLIATMGNMTEPMDPKLAEGFVTFADGKNQRWIRSTRGGLSPA